MPSKGVRATYKVRLEGPFFSPGAPRVFGQNIELMLHDVALTMEHEVERQIEARAGSMRFYTGWTTGTIKGRVASIGGKKWHRYAVVSANTAGMTRKDAIRTKAAASGIERRWHPFRRVASAARRIQRNLSKGLE